MTRRKLIVGQIVRKKNQYDKPIGPYLRIQHVEDDKVYAEIIGEDIPNIMLLRNNVYVPTISSLVISEEMLERLKKGTAGAVSHPATRQWKIFKDNNKELVRFYTQPKTYEAIGVIEYVEEYVQFREHLIKIVINRILI